MLECYNWLFCNLIGDNRFSVILNKSMMLSRPDPLPFYERVWLRQTIIILARPSWSVAVRTEPAVEYNIGDCIIAATGVDLDLATTGPKRKSGYNIRMCIYMSSCMHGWLV